MPRLIIAHLYKRLLKTVLTSGLVGLFVNNAFASTCSSKTHFEYVAITKNAVAVNDNSIPANSIVWVAPVNSEQSCISYKNKKQALTGLFPKEQLITLKNLFSQQTINSRQLPNFNTTTPDWAGSYENDITTIDIKPGAQANELKISALAVASNGHTGDFSADYTIDGNEAVSSNPSACNIHFYLYKNGLIATGDNGQCAGMGISFNGVYHDAKQ